MGSFNNKPFSRLSIEDISDISGINQNLNESQASTTIDDYEPQADLSTVEEDVGGFDFQAPSDGLKKELLTRRMADSNSEKKCNINNVTCLPDRYQLLDRNM